MSLENLPKSDAPPLEIHDLTVAYRNKPVLWGIDLVAPAGKLIGIVGPNGAGKSTLIKACMGLLPCSSGWVNAFGRPVAQSLGRVGYVPQRESVDWDFPVSVMDVVLMGRYGRIGLFKRPSAEDRRMARECLEQVQMLPFADRQISNLSGGQQQRVFLARALAQESDLYFMDEPCKRCAHAARPSWSFIMICPPRGLTSTGCCSSTCGWSPSDRPIRCSRPNCSRRPMAAA
jgi:manganese/zinc/iron transport system ATP- binding protein